MITAANTNYCTNILATAEEFQHRWCQISAAVKTNHADPRLPGPALGAGSRTFNHFLWWNLNILVASFVPSREVLRVIFTITYDALTFSMSAKVVWMTLTFSIFAKVVWMTLTFSISAKVVWMSLTFSISVKVVWMTLTSRAKVRIMFSVFQQVIVFL